MLHERFLRVLIFGLIAVTIVVGFFRFGDRFIPQQLRTSITSFFQRSPEVLSGFLTLNGRVIREQEPLRESVLVAYSTSEKLQVEWNGQPLPLKALKGFSLPSEVQESLEDGQQIRTWLVSLPSEQGELCFGITDRFSCFPLMVVARAAAPELPETSLIAPSSFHFSDGVPIRALQIHWEGTEQTVVDEQQFLAFDQSTDGRDFFTRLTLDSSLDAPVKLSAELVDESIRFTNMIPARSKGSLDFRVKGLEYGEHLLKVQALLPDGRKTAEVELPFRYQALRFAALGHEPLKLWQWGAIGILLLLGLSYLLARLSLWKAKH